ncbi:AsnC family transcriptional regulator [Bradyrhizobium canariense]|uniref:AsnC family transcriptional regulator n=1 Tax=Bradyrhizobium canariense TaxID=255045 RepID=A0ABX3XB29_9BRAD|nr:Lrp/AsnC family transcriptional regulator [Bradyrhizobium canariense]OSJ19446.1 AsnC family transcriptional regulator [Bradyrhizobium canariense]OSJ34910.1 AsnC family transcriptional regulator [Bradyrhizobium canariense]
MAVSCTQGLRASPKDRLDRDLLALLQANSRESVANLGRKLGIARTTVIARIARLEADGVIIGYTVRLGNEAADMGMQAYVGISVNLKMQRDVMRRLTRMPELLQLASVSGEFDYIAVLGAPSTTRLDGLLDEIAEIDGVVKTMTSVVLALRIDRNAVRQSPNHKSNP